MPNADQRRRGVVYELSWLPLVPAVIALAVGVAIGSGQPSLRRHFDPKAHVRVTDVTSAYAMLTIQGPKSRALLGSLTPDSLENDDFPYLSAREIETWKFCFAFS